MLLFYNDKRVVQFTFALKNKTMQQELLIAILAGLGGMLGWGFGDFFVKKTVDRIGSIVSLVWAHLFGTLIFILIAILQFTLLGKLISIPNNPAVWAGLLFFGILQMVVYWLVYEGFKKGQLAILNPIFASFAGIVALISIVFLGEAAGIYQILALFIIFAGVFLVSVDIKALRLKKLYFPPGVKEIGAATILAAIWTLSWDKFVGGQDALAYALFMYAFMTLAAFLISKFLRAKLSGVKSDLWKFLILIGLGETVAYLAITLGYSATSLTSVVVLISGAFPVPTIILARIFLKEKIARIQTIGTIIIITGIILLSLL